MEGNREFIRVLKALGYDEVEIEEIEFDCALTERDKALIEELGEVPADLKRWLRYNDIVRYLLAEIERLKGDRSNGR